MAVWGVRWRRCCDVDGVVERWNDGCWWFDQNKERKTLSEISALFESHLFPLDKGRSYLQQRLTGLSTLMDLSKIDTSPPLWFLSEHAKCVASSDNNKSYTFLHETDVSGRTFVLQLLLP